ncbi:hypothetical protein [Streptomyces sp. NPDC050564]|uniref:hypothetical protein n=1 Tax=Streptomyces sp. NPDC050564 TaxID=3365631 RepID=UPI0037B2CE0B
MHDLTSDRIRARLIEYPSGPVTSEERRDVNEQRFAMLEAEIERRINGGKAADAPWATPSMSAEGMVQAAFQTLRHLSDEAVIHLIAMGQLLWTTFGNPTNTITAKVTTASTTTTSTTTMTTKEICDHLEEAAPLHTRTRRKESTVSPPDHGGRNEGVIPDVQSTTALAR